MTRSPYIDALHARIEQALPDAVTLVDVDYRDRYDPADIQAAIENGSDALRERMDGSDWRFEAESAAIDYYARELPPLLAELYQSDMDTAEYVGEVLRDRDRSDPVSDIIGNTLALLFRYRVDCDGTTAYDVAHALGLDGDEYAANLEAIKDMLAESAYYGGSLHVLWYGDPAAVVRATDAAHYGTPGPSVIEWTNPHIVILDGINGSGGDAGLSATVRLPWDAARVCVDEAGPGYSWSKVAGPYLPAYAADVCFGGES